MATTISVCWKQTRSNTMRWTTKWRRSISDGSGECCSQSWTEATWSAPSTCGLSLVHYTTGIINWKKDELEAMDRKTRKMMTIQQLTSESWYGSSIHPQKARQKRTSKEEQCLSRYIYVSEEEFVAACHGRVPFVFHNVTFYARIEEPICVRHSWRAQTVTSTFPVTWPRASIDTCVDHTWVSHDCNLPVACQTQSCLHRGKTYWVCQRYWQGVENKF